MKNSSAPRDQGLVIDGSERETGLSKDLLRMWERQNGFPKPMRGENGERRYSVSAIVSETFTLLQQHDASALQRWRRDGEAGEAALVTPPGERTGTASAAETMAAAGSV
jgi:hypothetical protein